MQVDYSILCPMQEEAFAVISYLCNIKAPKILLNNEEATIGAILNSKDSDENLVKIYRNEEDKNPIQVAVIRVGIGRAMSSFNFAMSLSHFFPKKVIVCGVAGASTPGLHIGEVVYNKESRVLDFNIGQNIISGFSKLENEGFDFEPKIEYTAAEENFFNLNTVLAATIVSTDSFVYEEDKRRIQEELNNRIRIVVDMESAHLYYLCRKQNIPCIVFRGISDTMIGEAEEDFEANLPVAANAAAEVACNYIMEMDNARNEVLSKVEFVKDFPQKGVNFLDIQSLLKYPEAMDLIVDELVARICNTENKITKIAALDARGFILGTMLADRLNLPLILARKKGKLPSECFESHYTKEYGTDTIQIEKSALASGDRVLVVDDIAVTFGTINSVIDCVEQADAKVVGIAVFATIEEGCCSSSHLGRRHRDINLYSIFNF